MILQRIYCFSVTMLKSLPQHSHCCVLATAANIFPFLFPVKSVLKSKKEEISPLGSTMAKRPSGPLEVGTPFYQDGQLQVRVYWKNRGGMHSTVLIYSFVRIELAAHYAHQSLWLMYTIIKCYDWFSVTQRMEDSFYKCGIRWCKWNELNNVSLWELSNVSAGQIGVNLHVDC